MARGPARRGKGLKYADTRIAIYGRDDMPRDFDI